MKLKHLSLSVMMMGASAAVMASGYHFGTQSVSAQSTANASAAEAADASTIFYNAAGMTKLEGTNFSGAINLVMPSVEYSNASATYPTAVSSAYNSKVKGSSSGTITDDLIAVPHLYATHKLNDKMVVGVGIYVPFASSTEYARDSVLRYNLNSTSLKTIDINPSIAFKLNEQHSVAVGVIAQHAEASLRQYANFGYALTSAARATGVALLNGNGAADGFADVDGDDWGFGYNLAWMWDINDAARLGVNYRSNIEHTLKGTAKWAKSSSAATLNAVGFKDLEDASVQIDTPESLSVHGMFKLNPRVNMFGDVTWTKHSRFDKARLVYANTKGIQGTNSYQGDTTYLSPAWKDTYKVSLGGSYQYTNALQLRAGVAYDKSPVPDDNHRLATMPDNDRTWLSFGGKYDLSKDSSIDFAYSYIMIKDAKANVDGTCSFQGVSQCVSSQTKGTADYKSSAQIVGVQYNHRF